MDSVAGKTLEGAASEAAKKFEDEFDFNKMDKMIHRFPPGLGEIISSRYPYMVVPRFVAIGPYHHGKKHLEKMEEVKQAAAHYLFQRSQKLGQAVKAAAYCLCQRKDDDAGVEEALRKYITDGTVTQKEIKEMEDVLDAVKETRGKYLADETVAEKVVLYDACFLLLYMDAYTRSYEEEEDLEVDPSMRRFLFSNRHYINNDIMLLENQLPWQVIQVLMRLGSDLELKKTVGYFIAAMGSSFKIRESSKLKPYEWDDEKNPPPHLLALLRRHKTEEHDNNNHHSSPASSPLNRPLTPRSPTPPSPRSTSSSTQAGNRQEVVVSEISPPSPASSPLNRPLIPRSPTPRSTSSSTSNSTSSSTQAGNRQEVVVSAISPMDLEQIGIKLRANQTAKFSDMGLEKGWLFSRLIKLAPLFLNDTGASWLLNMAAFEVCTASRFGDPPERTAVCSYLALFAFFMVGSEDVRKLRSMGLLNGPDSDDEMLAFFAALKKHLPGYGRHFNDVMAEIEEYKQKRPIWTTLYRWVYNNWKKTGTVLSIIVAVVTAIATLIRLYQALLSLIHNN